MTQAGRCNKEPIRKRSYYLVMNANVGAMPERLPFSFASSGVIFFKKASAAVQQLSHRPHPLPRLSDTAAIYDCRLNLGMWPMMLCSSDCRGSSPARYLKMSKHRAPVGRAESDLTDQVQALRPLHVFGCNSF